jgi:hypothetical protein
MSEENKGLSKPETKQGVKVITQPKTDDKVGNPEETEGQNMLGNTNCGIC